MIDLSFLDTIKAIKWFASCGKDIAVDIPLVIQPVSSSADMEQAYLSQHWSDTTLEARNILTTHLHHAESKKLLQFPWRRRDWNKLTEAAKEHCVTPLTNEVWEPYAKAQGLREAFVHSVQWNVLAAIMEHEYRDSPGRPTFFLHLLQLYKAGHCPCGWSGGLYPKGKLHVF